MKVLVIAPHHDDEVLGVGGTMAKYAAEGAEVYVVIVTEGNLAECAEAREAHRLLGVKDTIFFSFPAAELDMVPHKEVNIKLFDVIDKIQPDLLFIPFIGDIHLDHQRIFLSSLVAARPNNRNAPKAIYAYETLSETNWYAPHVTANFVPNVFIEISEHLETKLQAMQMYESQIKAFPDERSEETLRALAILRGSTVNRFAAEAFYLIRQII